MCCSTLQCRPHRPVVVVLQVALPELDGALEPIVFAGRDSNTGKSHSLPDRIESLAKRAINWARLRKKKNADKKLAITVFSFPPDKGNVGTAAYLNVFGSIFRVLKNLKACGYDVGELPSNETELIQVGRALGWATIPVHSDDMACYLVLAGGLWRMISGDDVMHVASDVLL